MEYESRIYVTRKAENFDWDEVIAVFELCKMGWDTVNGVTFRNLFTEPVGEMYGEDGNTRIETDMYGDAVEGAPIGKVIAWLDRWLKDHDYPRARVFHTMLESMTLEIPGDLWCYHYGI